VFISITSDGGSVEGAIELGRQLRANIANVNAFKRCASACVLVLAGGVSRSTVEGDVEIHRPYSLDTSRTDLKELQENYDRTNRMVASYLRDMNLPDSLLDAMLRVPPHQGRLLTESELESYGLNQKDPVYEQARNAYSARQKGMSMMEYLRRMKLQEDCWDNHDWNKGHPNHCSSVWD
jgi:hypothetical protein